MSPTPPAHQELLLLTTRDIRRLSRPEFGPIELAEPPCRVSERRREIVRSFDEANQWRRTGN